MDVSCRAWLLNFRNGDGGVRLCGGGGGAAAAAMDCSLHGGPGPAERLQVANDRIRVLLARVLQRLRIGMFESREFLRIGAFCAECLRVGD